MDTGVPPEPSTSFISPLDTLYLFGRIKLASYRFTILEKNRVAVELNLYRLIIKRENCVIYIDD